MVIIWSGVLKQETLNRLNECLLDGMNNRFVDATLFNGFDMINKFQKGHGHLSKEEFGEMKKHDTLMLFLENIIKRSKEMGLGKN